MTRQRLWAGVLVSLVILVGALISRAQVESRPDEGLESRRGRDRLMTAQVRRGLELAPVPLNLEGKNPSLVGLGSYIVNVQAGCVECHTNPTFMPGGNPFLGQPEQINVMGYLAGGKSFGPFKSTNLTPDPMSGLPGGLTLAQFLHLMRTGEDPLKLPPPVPSPQRDLLQVMPWVVYRHMSDLELQAIYEYLSAIPSQQGFPR